MRTTSPIPVYRSTRDTRNSALWNPTSKELLSVEDDESGRLASFRARFGTTFDSQKGKKNEQTAAAGATSTAPQPTQSDVALQKEEGKAEFAPEPLFEEEQNSFAEDDANLLEFISSFGQQSTSRQGPVNSGKKDRKK
jgi:hypothetical protein